jgi:PAS domain-containing protein
MTSAGHGSDEARQARDIRRLFDAIPTLAWSARSDGSADFFNGRWLDYTGLSVEQARDIEGRLRRFDGAYRWFLFRTTPSFDDEGAVVAWFGTNTDIEDRKRAEDAAP